MRWCRDPGKAVPFLPFDSWRSKRRSLPACPTPVTSQLIEVGWLDRQLKPTSSSATAEHAAAQGKDGMTPPTIRCVQSRLGPVLWTDRQTASLHVVVLGIRRTDSVSGLGIRHRAGVVAARSRDRRTDATRSQHAGHEQAGGRVDRRHSSGTNPAEQRPQIRWLPVHQQPDSEDFRRNPDSPEHRRDANPDR